MANNILKIIWIVVFLFLFFILALAITKSGNSISITEGLWLKNYTRSKVSETTQRYDVKGDWVCVNVRGMSFERALEVCQHECGHKAFDEIFAEQCENNLTKCLEILN